MQRVRLYLWSVKRFILWSLRPLASKREGGQTGGILSPHAWVGSSSSQGRRREEEMKLLAFVAGLGIKDGGGIKGVPSVRKTPASVQG